MRPTEQVIRTYYGAFNQKNMSVFFRYLDDNVVHDVNQGGRQIGKAEFEKFMQKMNECYDEKVVDLVVMVSDQTPDRAAAEFFIEGVYLKADGDLPPAKQQKYRLAVGAFFELNNGKISRVTNYYNLEDWLRQVR